LTNTDVVLWHTFGITHFPSPEDFPVMPAEPMTLLLRPRNFFTRNPCLDIPPSYCSVPSGVKQGSTLVDKLSRMAFGEKKVESATLTCCSGEKFGAGV
jgi:primary-amine oxidase